MTSQFLTISEAKKRHDISMYDISSEDIKSFNTLKAELLNTTNETVLSLIFDTMSVMYSVRYITHKQVTKLVKLYHERLSVVLELRYDTISNESKVLA